jgi:hypothetical protein
MAKDLYSALIGQAPTDEEGKRAIVAALRRRRAFGELGALTGDPVLQSFGKEQLASAESAAEQLQATRQADVDDAQTREYQTGQLGHMGSVLKESIRAQDMDDSTTRRGQDMDLLEALYRAQNPRGGAAKVPRLRVSDIKGLQDLAQDVGSMEGIESFLKKGGKFGATEFAGVPIPGGRALSNALASRGFGDKEMKQAFLAKQSFDRLYTLGARNRLFGATLTSNEQTAWENANPSIRQSDEQIAEAIPILRKVLAARLESTRKGLKSENYSPEAIDYFSSIPGLNLPVEGGEEVTEGSAVPSAAPPPSTAQPLTARQKRIQEIKAKYGQP